MCPGIKRKANEVKRSISEGGRVCAPRLANRGHAWLGERKRDERRINSCRGRQRERERDEKGRNRWQVVQPKIWRQSS